MEEKISLLFKNINYLCASYVFQDKREIVEEMKTYIPDIQEFVSWYLSDNIYNICEEDYKQLQLVLLQIMKDIVAALEYNDKVLMHDALDYGFLEFIKMIVQEEGRIEEECNREKILDI